MRFDNDFCRSFIPAESYFTSDFIPADSSLQSDIKELSAGIKSEINKLSVGCKDLQSSVSNLMLMVTAVAAAALFLGGKAGPLDVFLKRTSASFTCKV